MNTNMITNEIKAFAVKAGNGVTAASSKLFDVARRKFNTKPSKRHANHSRPARKVEAYDWKKDGEIDAEVGVSDPVIRYSPTYRVFVMTDELTKAVSIIRVTTNTSRFGPSVSRDIIRIAAVTTEKRRERLEQSKPITPDDIWSFVTSAVGHVGDGKGISYATANALFMSEFAAIQAEADPKAAIVQWSLDGEDMEFTDPVGASGVDLADIADDLYRLALEISNPGEDDVAVSRKEDGVGIDGDDDDLPDMYMTEPLVMTLYGLTSGVFGTRVKSDRDPRWTENGAIELPLESTAKTLFKLYHAINDDGRLTSEDLGNILNMYHAKISMANPEVVPGEIVNRYRQLALALADGDEKMLWASAMLDAYAGAHSNHLGDMLRGLTSEEAEYVDSDDPDAEPVGRFAEPDEWANPYDKYIPDGVLKTDMTKKALYSAVGGEKVYTETHACSAIVDLTKYGPMAEAKK